MLRQMLRKIFIILINYSSDSNHSSQITVLVVVAFTKKKRRKINTNTKLSSEYFSVRTPNSHILRFL